MARAFCLGLVTQPSRSLRRAPHHPASIAAIHAGPAELHLCSRLGVAGGTAPQAGAPEPRPARNPVA